MPLLARLAAALVLILALAAPAAAAPTPAATPAASPVPPIPYKARVLANGLRVYTVLDRTTPNVAVQVWYGVGSKDDPNGRSGFAHLFEHLMFKATRDLPPESLDRLTEDVGGTNNASTWDDFTNYYETVPANHLERLVWAEANRMSGLVIDQANYVSERDVVKEELRQRVLAEPYGRLFNFYVPEASFTTHPYRRAGIGSIEDLDAATVDDVRAFHATYYRPDNAVLIIVGNFDEAQLNAWIDRYFGPIARPSAPLPRVTAVEPPRTGPINFTGYAPNVPLPAVVITWQAPAASSDDAAALAVLDTILSGGESSRLYNSLVYDQQIAAEIFSDADLRAQPGLFYVGAIMASGKTVDEGEAALRAQVAAVRDRPVTAAELSEAKNESIAAAVREQETPEGRADVIGWALMIDGDIAAVNNRIARLQAVTAADVQRVARTYLADDRRAVIRYLAESERPAGAAATAAATPPPAVASTPYTGEVFALRPEAERQAPPPVGTPVQAVLPTPVERTLSNGLRVIVAKSSDLPLVSASLVVRTGAAADPIDRAGANSLMAGLVTKGTPTRDAQEIASQTEALGAVLGAGSSWETSAVSLNVMPGQLAPAMTIMADVVRHPVFAEEELERARTQTIDGLSVVYQRPGSLASEATSPVVYAGTPFGHVASGTPASVARISRADVVGLHHRYWRPDNAVLVITGDITPEAGFALAEREFGDWRAPSEPLPAQPNATLRATPRAVVIDLPGTGQAAVVLVAPAIARSDPRYYPALVANQILGGGYSSRLSQEIRVKRGLSYGAYSSIATRRTMGAFVAATQTKNESAAEVVELIRTELTGLAGNPPSQTELIARRSTLIGDYGREIATTDGLAGALSELAFYGIDLSELAVYQARVEAVTPEQVRAFAADILTPGRISVIVVGDASKFLEAVGALVPTLEVIPAAEVDFDSPTLRRAPATPAP